MSIVPPASDLEPPAPNEGFSISEDTLHFDQDFDHPNPDIVLRSCDSRTFPVPKLYLANSSPILRELIRNVPNTSDTSNGENQESLPVVQLPESGATIHRLLTFIFPLVPFAPIVPSTPEEVIELLAAAQKYQMDSVLSHIRGIIARQDQPFILPETAFHIYFLAQNHEVHQEALQAARVTLRLPMVIEDLGDKLNFPGMTGAYLHELWKYHKRIRTDLKSGVPEFKNSGLPEVVNGLRCRNDYGDGDNLDSIPRWLDNYIGSITEAPHLDLMEFESAWARHIKEFQASYSRTCSCLDISSQLRRTFWEALTTFVHGTIEKADPALTLIRDEPTFENFPPAVPLCLATPDANFILRSSDQVDFRVHKSLLAMSSPFFDDLLSLPQPPGDELVDGLPVVQVPENAGLLNSLISLLYPTRRIQPASYEEVFALLNACQKYDMVLIQSFIRDEVRLGRFPAPTPGQAFRAYAIASSMELRPDMDNAARLTLGQPMTFESLGEGLRAFKGQALRELIRYRVANNSPSRGSNARRVRR